MRRALLYILAKEARPGLVKTRLCPPLSGAQAARLATAFADDIVRRLAGLSKAAGIEVRLALDDENGAAGGIRSIGRDAGVAVEGQGSGDLGARMAGLMKRGLATGVPTILVGTDSPDLPAGTVLSAIEALARVNVAVAPATDGGYVLIGARAVVRALFEIDAPWSGPHVFEATCRALTRAQCAFETLPAWDDVDDAPALARLARRLEESGGGAAPATARLLAEWKREGVRF
jgi:hypothetical protein